MAGTVYLSGPITGLSYQEARYGWRQEVADALVRSKDDIALTGITVLSPMRHEAHLAEMTDIDTHYPDHFFSKPKVIVEKDRLDIKRSDVVLVNVLGAKRVSIGTVSEIAMAYEQGKQIVLVMEDANSIDNRQYETDPLSSNPHEHPFVTELVSLRLNNLDDAVEAIRSLLSEGI